MLIPLLVALGGGPTCTDGICFVDHGASGDFSLGALSGSLAVIDYDGDGFQDLFVGDADGDQNRLFRNVADPTSPGGRGFVNVTTGSGLDDTQGTTREAAGVAVADYDNDGRLDIYVTGRAGNSSGLLYRNLGGGQFANVSVAAGIRVSGYRPQSPSFCDYDLDGDLDLMVCSESGGTSHLLLWRNDGGTFADASSILPAVASFNNAYSNTWSDYDQDGYSDCLVLADAGPSVLLQNVDDGGGGRMFVNVADAVGFTNHGTFPMGIVMGDYDGG